MQGSSSKVDLPPFLGAPTARPYKNAIRRTPDNYRSEVISTSNKVVILVLVSVLLIILLTNLRADKKLHLNYTEPFTCSDKHRINCIRLSCLRSPQVGPLLQPAGAWLSAAGSAKAVEEAQASWAVSGPATKTLLTAEPFRATYSSVNTSCTGVGIRFRALS